MSYNSKYKGQEVESLLDKVNDMGEIPTKVSELENDIPYVEDDVAIGNGIYIYDIDGQCTSPADWDTVNNDKAVGVAVLSDSCRFIVAKEDASSSSVAWGGISIDIPSLTEYSDLALAATDFNGAENTVKIVSAVGSDYQDGARWGSAAGDCRAYTFSNGKTGYLGSAGEWDVVQQHHDEIDSALILIGGTPLIYGDYWTSTEYDNYYAWVQCLNFGDTLQYVFKSDSSYNVRAFLSFVPIKPVKQRITDLEQQLEDLGDDVYVWSMNTDTMTMTVEELEKIRSASLVVAIYNGMHYPCRVNDMALVFHSFDFTVGKVLDYHVMFPFGTSNRFTLLTQEYVIPESVTESTVSGWGFTKNTGTYSKPSTGIPESDLDAAVQTLLGKADTALQQHQDISGKLDKTEAASTYLSKTEASSTYLGKTAKAADATKADSATKATQDGNGNNIVNTYATKNDLNGKGTYSKPSTGIPKSDLASAVQTSLGKADTALQSYTEQYKGTVTGIKVNGSTKTPSSGTVDIGNVVTGVKINGSTKSPSSGTIDLGTVITAHQDISGKQDKLVSGTNIKTINGTSILGSGNIVIEGGGGGSSSGGSGAYVEVNHGTSDTTFTLTPNTFHVWDEVASLDLSFADEQTGVANEYLFQFTSGATATTITLPDVKWANDAAPTIAENMIYQVSVLKGLASVLEFSNESSMLMISFAVGGIDYNADPGMTWFSWIESDYPFANDGFSFYRNEAQQILACTADDFWFLLIDPETEMPVKSEDEIKPDVDYNIEFINNPFE